MATGLSVGKARADKDGNVVLLGDDGEDVVTWDEPSRAADAAEELRLAAVAGMTTRAGLIAENRALVGSASHHMDRGASAAFHFDRRAAHVVGAPTQEEIEGAAEPAVGTQEEPQFVPGDSPVTGTGQASVDALEGPRSVAGIGAFAEPEPGSDEGLQGGPPGTVSPPAPGDGEGSGSGDDSNDDEDQGSGPFASRSKAQLQAAARAKGVSTSGNKEELVKRLQG